MNLKITKLPNRYCCMCMLTYLYASLQFLIKKKEKNFGRSPPMSTLMIAVTIHDQSVSWHIPSGFVCVHSISLQVHSLSLHIYSISINLDTVYMQTQTLIVHVHSIQEKTWHVTTQEKCEYMYTNTSLIHADRFQVSLHDYICMHTTVNSCKCTQPCF